MALAASNGQRAKDTGGQGDLTITVLGTGYDLALDKRASASSVSNSNPVTFTVRVTNSGPLVATGVRVGDTMPAINQTLQNTQVSQGSISVREDSDLTTVNWDVGDLPANAAATLTITVLAHLNLTNTARITGGLEDDTNANNNSDSFTVTVGG